MRMPRRSLPVVTTVAAAVVALVALTACGTSTKSDAATAATTTTAASVATTGADSATSTTTTDVATGAAVASRGCDLAPSGPVHLERRELPVAELTRWYLITVPTAASSSTPLPLVLDFHGLTEGAEVHAKMTGMGDYAEAHGFVAVLPQGTGDLARWAAGPGGDASSPNADIDFVAALLDQIEATQCIDRSRVYATGLSNGAMLTSMLACRLANRFAAVAPVAGATDFTSCTPSAVVPMLTIHGTADPILLFNGGVGDLVKVLSGGKAASTAPATTTIPTDVNGPGYPANVAAWAKRNGCEPTPTDTEVTEAVTLRTYDCPRGADVEMYIVAGGGHAWPGSEFSRSIESIVGLTTFDIDATDVVWKFFQRFRRAP